jgi:hypothetical protein
VHARPGWDDVYDDPKMGWSRWAHTIRVFTLNSGLFYIRPNERTLALMDRISDRLMKNKEWDQVPACLRACTGPAIPSVPAYRHDVIYRVWGTTAACAGAQSRPQRVRPDSACRAPLRPWGRAFPARAGVGRQEGLPHKPPAC